MRDPTRSEHVRGFTRFFGSEQGMRYIAWTSRKSPHQAVGQDHHEDLHNMHYAKLRRRWIRTAQTLQRHLSRFSSDDSMHRPPCWPEGQSCPNDCAAQEYERLVHNRLSLNGPWAGWRFAGRDLVAPDGARISAERLRGLLFRQELEQQRDRARAKRKSKNQIVRVVVVDLATYRVNGADAS